MADQIETRLFIDGNYVARAGGESFADIEPATGHEFASIPDASADEVSRAVEAAVYLWTSKLARALRVAERIRTGMVWVNSFLLRDLRTPFGGAKQSGLGHQGGRYALEFWTEPKLICMAYGEEDGDG